MGRALTRDFHGEMLAKERGANVSLARPRARDHACGWTIPGDSGWISGADTRLRPLATEAISIFRRSAMTDRICGQGSSWLVGEGCHLVMAAWSFAVAPAIDCAGVLHRASAASSSATDARSSASRARRRLANLRLAQAAAKQPKRALFRAAAGANSIRSNAAKRCTIVAKPLARDRRCTDPKAGPSSW